jgi:hypothetical protein
LSKMYCTRVNTDAIVIFEFSFNIVETTFQTLKDYEKTTEFRPNYSLRGLKACR